MLINIEEKLNFMLFGIRKHNTIWLYYLLFNSFIFSEKETLEIEAIVAIQNSFCICMFTIKLELQNLNVQI